MTRLRLLEITKWICFGALAAFLIVQAAGSRASSAPMAAVEKAVLAKADESKMKKADELMIRRLYGIDPSGYRSVRLYYPDTNMGAEELFLARMKDRSQKDALIGAIRAREASQEKSFSGYGTAQTAMLQKSVIEEKGGYVLFVSASKPQEAKRAFEQAVRKG